MRQKNYSPLVLFHYRNPRHFGKLKKSTLTAEELNPLCGDEITVYFKVKDGALEDLKYEARGCALSIAAASVLSEKIMNQELRIRNIAKIGKSDLENWLGIKVSPARETCITLALNAIKKSTSPSIPPLTRGGR